MIGFKDFLFERKAYPAEKAGRFEIVKTPLPLALEVVKHVYHSNHTKSPKTVLPNFVRNYGSAQAAANLGKTIRKDMPVIHRSDAHMLQTRLMRGAVDVHEPYASKTDPGNPFPEGLTGKQAQEFLTNGFRDGKLSDDKVKSIVSLKRAGSLKPIQHQIYLDKALTFGMNYSKEEFVHMVGNSFMITSSDNFILDGHHRWLYAMLLDPNIPMKNLEIDLPLKDLLKVLAAYGDAIGNERNH